MERKGYEFTAEEWFKQTLETLENEFEFRFEVFISDITNEICKIMNNSGINRTQLAKKLEISPPAVTRMLDGNPNFTLRRLLNVAEALNQELSVKMQPKKPLLKNSVAEFGVDDVKTSGGDRVVPPTEVSGLSAILYEPPVTPGGPTSAAT